MVLQRTAVAYAVNSARASSQPISRQTSMTLRVKFVGLGLVLSCDQSTCAAISGLMSGSISPAWTRAASSRPTSGDVVMVPMGLAPAYRVTDADVEQARALVRWMPRYASPEPKP